MKVKLKKISGLFTDGYALDKHSISSTYIGDNEYGYPKFETIRTEVGEAVYQLKYCQDFDQVDHLAEAVVDNIKPHLPKIGLVLPAPASDLGRKRQPVHEVAKAISERWGAKFFSKMITTSNAAKNTESLKNMSTREEKDTALSGRYQLNRTISNEGHWNALVVDDLYHTGATMDAVCGLLAQYDKIKGVYVAALTWR